MHDIGSTHMKAIIYLPLVTAALLLGWYLFAPDAAPPPVTASVSSANEQRTIELPPTIHASQHVPAAPAELPASVRGTDVDGRLEVDAEGNLLITGQIRHLFDYFLSLIGEEDASTSQQRVRAHLAQQLEQPALDQALVLLDSYLDYQQQLADLENRYPVTESLADLLDREQAVQQLRASIFSREAHGAFFAGEEIYNNFTLERLTIHRDDFLNPQQKAQAIEALRENLPEEMQQLLVPQIQQELREQTLALVEAGAGDAAIHELRMGLLGPEATLRLEALDQRRAEWRQRVDAFNQERESILAHPGMAASDRQAAVNALLQEQFTETEQLRVAN